MHDHLSKKRVKSTICPGSKKQIQLCSFLIRGGKRITPIRFCGYASPKLHKFRDRQQRVCNNIKTDTMPTRHAEIGAINALTYKAKQSRLLHKTTLVVIRFIEPPPRRKWKRDKVRYKIRNNSKFQTKNSYTALPDEDDDNEDDRKLNQNEGDLHNQGDEHHHDDGLSLRLACSRPCSECIKIIRALRIKSVIYVNDEHELVNKNPDDIECTVHSGGTLGIIERRIT